MKVLDLVEAQNRLRLEPGGALLSAPYLTLGQIHGALSYYWDHKAEGRCRHREATQTFKRVPRESRPFSRCGEAAGGGPPGLSRKR